MNPFQALRRLFVHEAVKTEEEEQELQQTCAVDFDVEENARLSNELAERVYEEDIAYAFQAKILKQEHHPAQDPSKDWGFGTAGRLPRIMNKKKPTP